MDQLRSLLLPPPPFMRHAPAERPQIVWANIWQLRLVKNWTGQDVQDLDFEIRFILWQRRALFVFDKCLALPTSVSSSTSYSASSSSSNFFPTAFSSSSFCWSWKTFYVLGSIRCDYEQSFWLFINLMTLHLANVSCYSYSYCCCCCCCCCSCWCCCNLKLLDWIYIAKLSWKSFATEIKV